MCSLRLALLSAVAAVGTAAATRPVSALQVVMVALRRCAGVVTLALIVLLAWGASPKDAWAAAVDIEYALSGDFLIPGVGPDFFPRNLRSRADARHTLALSDLVFRHNCDLGSC